MIKIDEDRDFLVDQRGDRKMFVTSADTDLAKKQERSLQCKREKEERRQRYKNFINSLSAASEFEDEKVACRHELNTLDNPDNIHGDSDNDFMPRARKCTTKKKIATKSSTSQLFTPHVTSALDRNKTSDCETVRLMIPIAAALGHNPSYLSLSRNTVQRMRKKARMEHAELTK